MTEPQTAARGIVLDGPYADLTVYRSAEELDGIERIEAGCVVVRKSLAAAAARIPADVGATFTVPDDVAVRIHAGMVTLGGAAFAPEDGPDTALILVGGMIVVGEVPKVTYRQISVIGLALIPRGSESVIGEHLTDLIGASRGYDYSDGVQVRSVAGRATLSGAMIENASGQPGDVLLVAGTLVIDEPFESVGYQLIIVAGLLIGPRDCRDRFGAVLEVSGEALWYRGDHPRVVEGTEVYEAEFLAMIDEPLSLIVLGDLTFGADVTSELVRQAVADIVLTGTITVPRAAAAAVQLLCREKSGVIMIAEDFSG